MMRTLLLATLGLALAGHVSANDWPSWRGPASDGTLPADAEYPEEWSATDKLRWRVEMPGPGNSSPIVVGEKVFLTQAVDGGKTRSLRCLSAEDGKTLWEKDIDYGKTDPTHRTNPYSAASPVSDGNLVFAWHGNAGLHAYDLEGNERWSRDLGSDYAHQWGPNAASPVLHGDKLIVHAGPGTSVALFCLDKASGETIWSKDLPEATSKDSKEFKGSWATPLLVENAGRTEMLVGLPGSLRSFDPDTGEELWRCGGLSDLCYTNPIVGEDFAVYLCGYGGPGMGMKLPAAGETGDLTDSHRLWVDQGNKRNRQRIGTGQLVDGYLYQLDEPGVAVCLDPRTGEKIWEERLGRKSWSSMNLVGGKLYVNDQSGTTFVIDPDPEGLRVVSRNPVDPDQHTNATPAFARGSVFLRTEAFLYAFGE